MASTNGVIFPESTADFLANPVNICFGSMPATSTAPAACLVIEGNSVTTNQQIKTDLSKQEIFAVTAAHHRQLNQESSPDRLAFQVTHTTISPNYPREELETLDRQILVVSADVPPQDGETDAQRQERENANAARAVRRQQEVAAAAPGAGLQPANAGQVNANAGQQALMAPATPQQ
jgi:hypothetical protein